MANKYYVYEDVNGNYNITDKSWDEVQKIPRRSVKGFKTKEEATAYYESVAGSFGLHNSSIISKNSATTTQSTNKSVFTPTPPNNIDAIIYTDGSFQAPSKGTSDAYYGSYGIIIFTKNGTYVETTLLKDPENQDTDDFINNAYFEENRYKYDNKTGGFIIENANHPFTVYNKTSEYGYGILHTGWASGAEFCGATRCISICKKMNFKNVLLVYDAKEVKESCLKYQQVGNTSNASNLFKQEVKSAKASGLNIIVNDYTKVDSHEAHVFNPAEHDNYFGKFDYIYNEVVDILAKIQLQDQPIFNSKKKNENRNIYAELLPEHSELIDNMKLANENPDRTDAIELASEFIKVVLSMKHPYFS